jgi:putative Mn2+ efflux pump MntP
MAHTGMALFRSKGPAMSRDLSNDFKLAILVLSLGLDTLAVAVSLGIAGIGRRNRVRVGLSFALFEGGMPLIGFVAGRLISGAIGDIAAWLGIIVLLAVGVYMVYESVSGEVEANFNIDTWRGLVLISLSVSMDELAIGFSMGALGLPIVLAVVLIAAQAFVLTFAGTALGNRIGERLAERAESVAGVVLAGLAVALAVGKVVGR